MLVAAFDQEIVTNEKLRYEAGTYAWFQLIKHCGCTHPPALWLFPIHGGDYVLLLIHVVSSYVAHTTDLIFPFTFPCPSFYHQCFIESPIRACQIAQQPRYAPIPVPGDIQYTYIHSCLAKTLL